MEIRLLGAYFTELMHTLELYFYGTVSSYVYDTWEVSKNCYKSSLENQHMDDALVVAYLYQKFENGIDVEFDSHLEDNE